MSALWPKAARQRQTPILLAVLTTAMLAGFLLLTHETDTATAHDSITSPETGMGIHDQTSCTDDSFEENDTQETASPVALRFAETDLRICSQDYDYFAFPLSEGETVQAEAFFSHADGNIDIALHDPAGAPVAVASSLTDNEKLAYTCCGPAGAGTYAVEVILYQDDPGPSPGNSYDLEITSAQPTPCGPGGCPTPTVTPTPFPDLDFSIGIDADGDTNDDCGTRPGEATKCFVSQNTTFALRIYLNGLGEIPHYRGYDAVLLYTGVQAKYVVDTGFWPACGLQAILPEEQSHNWPDDDVPDSPFVAFGCVALPPDPSTYIGLLASTDFNCADSGTVTMVHNITSPEATGATSLTEDADLVHAEGIGTTESLTINCVEPAAPTVPAVGGAGTFPDATGGGAGGVADIALAACVASAIGPWPARPGTWGDGHRSPLGGEKRGGLTPGDNLDSRRQQAGP